MTRPLSKPEVIALVDFKIETRPRETQVDRSYANIGLLAHRNESITERELFLLFSFFSRHNNSWLVYSFHRGFDRPAKLYKHGRQRQNQRGITATLGLSAGRPVATAAFTNNKTSASTLEATDTKVGQPSQ